LIFLLERRSDEPPHVLVAAKPVGKEHRLSALARHLDVVSFEDVLSHRCKVGCGRNVNNGREAAGGMTISVASARRALLLLRATAIPKPIETLSSHSVLAAS
jgi:hypothetical protein